MTRAEAEQIAGIMLYADGQCFLCAAYLCEDFAQAFPSHRDIIEQTYKKEFRHTPKERIENP